MVRILSRDDIEILEAIGDFTQNGHIFNYHHFHEFNAQ